MMRRVFTVMFISFFIATVSAQQDTVPNKFPLPYRQAWSDFEAGYNAFYHQNYTLALEKFNACVKRCEMLNRNRAFAPLRKNIDYMLNDMQRAIEEARKLQKKFGDVKAVRPTGGGSPKVQPNKKNTPQTKAKTQKQAKKKNAAAPAPPPANIAGLEAKLKNAGGAKDADAAVRLAELYLQAGNLKKAEKWARQATSWNRRHFKARFTLASIYMKAAELSTDEKDKESKKTRARTNLKLARIYCNNENEKAMVEDALAKLGK